jgi:hypothetical protein
MLGQPKVTLGVRGSWFKAAAGSDIYDFVTDEFTIDKSDFSTGTFSAELSVNVAPRFDVTGRCRSQRREKSPRKIAMRKNCCPMAAGSPFSRSPSFSR